MKFTASILSEEEKLSIHQQSIRILAEVGVRFLGEKANVLLKANGIKVDTTTGIARIPADVVDQTMATAPKRFILGARNPAHNYQLPSPITRYALDGTAAFMVDFHSGQRRYGEKRDIFDSMRIFQQADMGVMAWPTVCASDTPAPSRALHEFFTMIQGTSKHGQHELHTVEQVPFLVEGLEVVAGSADELRTRNLYSLIYCPVAPLTHDGPMLDAYLELGQAGVPVMVMPMPVNGTTGPASLYSNIALANAETLSSFVIYQLANPGRPIIYSSATGSVDFRSGAYLAGTAEMGLQSAALVQMGRYYGFPATSAGMTSDAKEPGAEAVIEKLITTIPGVQVGSDIIVGFGEIESDQALYLEQILIDNEIAHLCERLVQGVDVSEEKDLFADIAKIGPGGHFLAEKTTRAAARSNEFYKTQFSNHQAYESWMTLGKPSMVSNARTKVEEILSSSPVDPLTGDINEKLEDILKKADRALKDLEE